MTERWLPVVGWEGLYEVSDLGRVKRVAESNYARAGRVLIPQLNGKGYRQVTLARPGVKTKFRVHRLVSEAFIGLRPDGLQVNHKNGIKFDNRLSNLEYVTPQENIQHSLSWRLFPLGSSHHNAKLNEDKVKRIRVLLRTTRLADIAREFGVTSTTIEKIQKGITWRHVEDSP